MQIRQLIHELVGEQEIYGVAWNEDQSQVQVRVFVEDLPYLQTFSRDPESGKYVLESESPLGQQKL